MHDRATSWMPKPPAFTGCPPGLEYLSVIDHIFLQEIVEERGVFTSVINKYWVKNKMGQIMYRAEYDRDTGGRFPLRRPTDMDIIDNLGRKVIHLHRPNNCGYPFEHRIMKVYAPIGEIIGSIVEEWTCHCYPSYIVQNSNEEDVFRLKGECCAGGCTCTNNLDFKLLSIDNKVKLGKIQRHWAGWLKDLFVNTENFGVSFPVDFDVRMKAVMLGACILISYVYYEKMVVAVT